jgi:nitrite reductase (NADH) small subunit
MSLITVQPPGRKVRVKVCRIDELSPGIGKSFNISGQAITVFLSRNGELHATQSTCPHAGGPLADGILSAGCVVCPYHAHRFNLVSGRCESPSVSDIATFKATVVDHWVSIELPFPRAS